jgi:hypothetical protein
MNNERHKSGYYHNECATFTEVEDPEETYEVKFINDGTDEYWDLFQGTYPSLCLIVSVCSH